ncbi:MAG: DUF1573 domain-containing protein [Bacteroidales bacterium]|nr:DUF1573 domain-containing protein [Bacteroidales bacterium]
MKSTILLLISLLTLSFVVNAQVGKIKFDKETHDYGTLEEEMGKAEATFHFTNVGDGDLKIVNVKTSCGCTASDYSKNVIKPGEKGFVKATYFTKNRPGPFRKTITVTTNDVDKPNSVLVIKGTVTPKPKTEAEKYPTTMGNLKAMSNHIAFMQIKNHETKTDSMKIFNNWTREMTFNFEQVPAHITAKLRKNTLKPQESTYLIISYDAAKRNDYGLLYDRIAIKTNDDNQPIKILNVSANIIEDFSVLTPKQLKKAPVITFDSIYHDFGKIGTGALVTYQFKFKNTGKSDLIIRKTKASCGCTAIAPAESVIKKGKSSYIEVKFNTTGYQGQQKKTVTIITNDPKNHEITLTLTGEVVK